MALQLEPAYKSGLEKKVAAQLAAEGVEFIYEPEKLPYTVPARDATYLYDFGPKDPKASNIRLEAKGRFGGRFSDNKGAQERQKLILVKEQHPELDIRIIFQDANKKIYKGSKTTYAKWADDHGFLWSDKGVIPAAWIKELKRKRRT